MVTASAPAGTAAPLRAARIAVVAVFFVNGLLFASWTAHIPHVKAHLGLTDATLGFALLGAPVGSVLAMLLSAYLLPRLGSRTIVQVSLVGYCAAGPFVGLTGSPLALFAALFAWGAFQGTLDVSMNTQAIAVERAHHRVLMPGLHGSWSIGSFAGAAVGALAVGLGASLSVQLLVMATIALLCVGLLTVRMLPDAADDSSPRVNAAARWSAGMLTLGAIAFAGMLCEGAAADWAAVYLNDSLHAAAVVAGLGYAAFASTMVIVRLCGNRLLTRFGTSRLLPALAALASVGFGAGLLLATPVAALLGFACLGTGLASVIPAVFSAAGRLPGLHPGTAVATASACGWIGFVCGPPLIGQLASLASLPVALGILPVLTAFIAVATARASVLRSPRDLARP